MPAPTTAKVYSPDYLKSDLEKKLIGQPDAINAVVPIIDMYRAGLNPENRPVGTVLLLGPTGTGKTKLPEALSEVIHGTNRVLRIDCAEYQLMHEAAKLIGCFTSDTPVLMSDGSRKKISNIEIGDSVITHKGRSRRVEYLHKYEHDGEMVSLETSNHNLPLVCTPQHKIWAIRVAKPSGRVRDPHELYDPENFEWVAAGDLQKNDIVAYPRVQAEGAPPDKIDLLDYCSGEARIKYDDQSIWYQKTRKINRFIEVNEELARFVGYFVSDGHTRNAKGGIHFTLGVPQKQAVLDDLENIVPRIFGDDVRYHITDKGADCKRFNLSYKVVALFTGREFGLRSLVKRLPQWCLNLSENLTWNLLDAAIMCDGSRAVTRRVDYSTSSETLYSQIQLLLRRLGFTSQSQIRESNRYGIQCATRYRMYVAGSQITRFAECLPLAGSGISIENSGNNGIQRMSHVDDQYVYFRLKETPKKLSYEGAVYDIAVTEDRSYVAENTIVSNSPPGYLGHRETKPILNQASVNEACSDGCRLSILVFDEIEKAHPAFFTTLLAILDKGRLTLGDNTTVSFESTLIFFTSNLGGKEMQSAMNPNFGWARNAGTQETKSLEAITTVAMKKFFTPEFINRIDVKITYKPLSREHFGIILEQILNDFDVLIQRRLEAKAFDIRVTGKAKNLLLDKGVSAEYGARELKRTVQKNVIEPVAVLAARGSLTPEDTVVVDVLEDKFIHSIERQAEDGQPVQ